MIDDVWTWRALLRGGGVLEERVLGSIHSVPAELVETLLVEHRHTRAVVGVQMDTGMGFVALPGEARREIRPAVLEASSEPCVPLFFRRRTQLIRPGERPVTTTEFRALGYVVFRDGAPWHTAAVRVYDDRIENRFHCSWPESTATHVASTAALLGSA